MPVETENVEKGCKSGMLHTDGALVADNSSPDVDTVEGGNARALVSGGGGLMSKSVVGKSKSSPILWHRRGQHSLSMAKCCPRLRRVVCRSWFFV